MKTAPAIAPPDPSEYMPFQHAYISVVGGSDVLASMERLGAEARVFYSGLSEDWAGRPYGPGKWTIREVLGHIIDTERIQSYRALRISRNDTTPLPGFEQDDFVANGPYSTATLADLVEEFTCLRQASLLMFRRLDEAAWMRRGFANNGSLTVRALGYLVAGHELHHRKILQAAGVHAAVEPTSHP